MKFIVRHGIMRHLGEFEPREGFRCARGMEVIVRSERGHEIAEVLCESSEQALAMITDATHGSILRERSADDRASIDRLHKNEQRAFEACKQFIHNRKLQMELVDVENL
ncbi:MAG: PSP1 C-terminal domain-containing protein, partial [Gemmataceae bacterium]